MWDPLSKSLRLLLVPAAALAFFLGAYFFFNRGSYNPPPTVSFLPDTISSSYSSFNSFTELPAIQAGTLLLDAAHSNNFSKAEMVTLLGRVADRGYNIEFIGDFHSLGSREGPALLEEKLRRADSFVVVLPTDPYPREEGDIVERFVREGGKLLLIAGPTRSHQINSLAERFGISFQPDYLYNSVEHDLYFQDIFIKNFRPDALTAGLNKIALYSAGSIKSYGPGLAFTDGDTRSSIVGHIEPFFPLVKGKDDHVVAIADLAFMIPPQNSILDNDRLVSNIADYLTTSTRRFTLTAFPHLFKGDLDIIMTSPTLLSEATRLNQLLAVPERQTRLAELERPDVDTVIVGLYQDLEQAEPLLRAGDIDFTDSTIRTPFGPPIAKEGSGLLYLDVRSGRHVLVVLADTPSNLEVLVGRLGSGRFQEGLVAPNLGLYRLK